MSAKAMGTNDCTAEGRREAKSVSINVGGYECGSATVIAVHRVDVHKKVWLEGIFFPDVK